MGGPALQKQQTPTQSGGASTQATTAKAPAQGGAGNQAAIDQLAGKSGGTKKPSVNMGAVNSGASFVSAATAAMDAAVPTNGSFASLKVSGRIPIASIGVAAAYIEPSLELQLARGKTGEFEVTMASQIGLRAEAGSNGGGWWPKFMAYFKGYVKGSLKIVGDSAGEIMRQFMLTLRLVIEGACDAAGAPSKIKSMMSEGIMSNASKKATIEGMDAGDSISASIGGGVEAGAEASVLGGASATAEVNFTKKIENADSNKGALEVSSNTSVTVKGSFDHKKLGIKITPSVTFVFAGGKLTEFFVGLGASKEMKLGEFGPLALMGTEWATEFGIAIKELIKDAANKSRRSEVAQISSLVGGLAMGPEALKYTAFGEQLKAAAKSPDFAGQSAMKIKFALSAQAGWSKKKGINGKGALNSESSFTLGGKTSPLSIEVKSGQPIATLG